MEYLKLRAIRVHFPCGVAELICDFAKSTAVPYDSWAASVPLLPEYDCNGHYGQLPMCPLYVIS